MADLHELMTRRLAEYDKKYPDRSHAFKSTRDEDLQIATTIDGWQIVKEPGAGTVGEVKCGDLVLMSRPRSVSDEERAQLRTKTAGGVAAAARGFDKAINDAGGSGRYLAPLSPAELARFGSKG